MWRRSVAQRRRRRRSNRRRLRLRFQSKRYLSRRCPQQPSPPVAEEVAAPTDAYGDLMKLKELLDAGVLTQAEFDAQKQKILAS